MSIKCQWNRPREVAILVSYGVIQPLVSMVDTKPPQVTLQPELSPELKIWVTELT